METTTSRAERERRHAFKIAPTRVLRRLSRQKSPKRSRARARIITLASPKKKSLARIDDNYYSLTSHHNITPSRAPRHRSRRSRPRRAAPFRPPARLRPSPSHRFLRLSRQFPTELIHLPSRRPVSPSNHPQRDEHDAQDSTAHHRAMFPSEPSTGVREVQPSFLQALHAAHRVLDVNRTEGVRATHRARVRRGVARASRRPARSIAFSFAPLRKPYVNPT